MIEMNQRSKQIKFQTVVKIIAVFGMFSCSQEPDVNNQKTASTVPKVEFLNLAPDVEYVGDEDCELCHSKIFNSFKKTGMGRSFYPLTASNVVEDFSKNNHTYDEKWNFHYEAISKNGEFYQVEYRLDADGRRIHELSRKMEYVVGSGNQARTYLTEENGFFFQLPLTWYTDKQKWDMSPGYESVRYRFSRRITADCMNCHNSYAEFIPYSGNRFDEVPHGIGCERCHGPGELHVEARLNDEYGDATKMVIDSTIVNPRHLSGELQMEVCFQCHLQPQTAILKPGQREDGFRPGMKMADVRSIYVFDDLHPGDLRLAGHGQRFAASECYKESNGKLTCITCHDPHKPVKTISRAHFNTICQTCHEPANLSKGRPSVIHNATGDCVKCHMQQGNTTDVEHVNFTDHWIQKIPAPLQKTIPNETAILQDFYSEKDSAAALRQSIANLQLLGQSNVLGKPFENAISKVSGNMATNPDHEEGLYYLGVAYASKGRYQEAAKHYRALTQVSPQNPLAHLQLAKMLGKLQRPKEAIQACQTALELLPENPEALTELGSLYMQVKKPQLAAQNLKKAIAIRPGYAPAHIAMGELLVKTKQSQVEARKYFLNALTLEPDNISTLDNLGNLAMLSNNPAIAAIFYEQILKLDAAHIPAYAYLSYIYSSQNEFAKAISYLQQALKVDPDNDRIKTMMKQLRDQMN